MTVEITEFIEPRPEELGEPSTDWFCDVCHDELAAGRLVMPMQIIYSKPVAVGSAEQRTLIEHQWMLDRVCQPCFEEFRQWMFRAPELPPGFELDSDTGPGLGLEAGGLGSDQGPDQDPNPKPQVPSLKPLSQAPSPKPQASFDDPHEAPTLPPDPPESSEAGEQELWHCTGCGGAFSYDDCHACTGGLEPLEDEIDFSGCTAAHVIPLARCRWCEGSAKFQAAFTNDEGAWRLWQCEAQCQGTEQKSVFMTPATHSEEYADDRGCKWCGAVAPAALAEMTQYEAASPDPV